MNMYIYFIYMKYIIDNISNMSYFPPYKNIAVLVIRRCGIGPEICIFFKSNPRASDAGGFQACFSDSE